MACNTLNCRMLGYFFLKQIVRLVVAACADEGHCLLVIVYLGWLMYRVTDHAVCCGHLNFRAVGFVACIAFRNVAMFFRMAVSTGYFAGVSARIFLYFITLFGVAGGA